MIIHANRLPQTKRTIDSFAKCLKNGNNYLNVVIVGTPLKGECNILVQCTVRYLRSFRVAVNFVGRALEAGRRMRERSPFTSWNCPLSPAGWAGESTS